MTRTRLLAVLAVLALILSGCGVTRGDESGPPRLRMMIPNRPGGGYDLTGRAAVASLEDAELTKRFEVFNVTGASGTVAMARLMNERGAEDVIMTMGLGVVGALYTNKAEAKLTDATPIARLIEESEGVAVPANSPYTTIDELVAAWRADPGGVTVGGGSSPGGPDHLFPMELARAVGIKPADVNYTPYDGGGDLLAALLGSKIDMATTGLGEFTDQIAEGKIRVLAVSGEKPVAGVDAPTLQEAGIDLVFINWRGVLAPPGISAERKQQLIDLITQMHASQQWKDQLAKYDWTDAFLVGDEFGTFLKEQDQMVATTLDELGLL
ncbi:Bug family tripartite tricarboxylate transporter substrate binding protein [Nostocoides sp.]|uniref:Bug family tripartite tricarboxylate transporter substrate binding protein n=1 Tax=Nostocoides sp. TaxID=1917966 RepID=UPI002B8EECEB|nr:tripartite tricarboxylate transporter substrate-binding protein [Tetrasphaera sp.]